MVRSRSVSSSKREDARPIVCINDTRVHCPISPSVLCCPRRAGLHTSGGQGMKLAVSSYSFSRFGAGPEGKAKPSFNTMIERCADLGIEGIELLGVHFESTQPEDLNALKRF